MKKVIAIASAAALGLALTACDSGAENAAEEQAEVVDEQSEMQAEAVEEMPGGEAEAEAIEEAGEEQADAMEEAADDADGGAPE